MLTNLLSLVFHIIRTRTVRCGSNIDKIVIWLEKYIVAYHKIFRFLIIITIIGYNIVIGCKYLLTKYFSILTSRFSAISLWLNSCHMWICWHDCARIHPNIDNSKNAIYPICRGWMAAGYQMKGNIVFYLLTKHFSNITSRFAAMQVSI